jgi:hypothetical protein
MDNQFACAWVYDDRQILCYVWQDDDGQDYVLHMTQDPGTRIEFKLKYKSEVEAQTYLSNIKHSRADVRRKIENTLDSIFEKAGKDYEQEEGRNENENDTEDPPFEN